MFRFSGKLPAIAAVSGILISANRTSAADQWLRLDTPHFQLYTTAGEKKGREAILYFEQVRSFFQQASASKAEQAPVRIIAFRSEGQYKPYRMNEGSVAYYARSQSREYIVMQDIGSEEYPSAIHEYTHLIIQRDGLTLPTWLNEGWADLNSTLRPQGNKAMIGALIPGRLQTLLLSKMIDISVLGSIDEKSPMYNETNKAGIFYAESWALVHMLNFSGDYRPNFTKFVVALASGQDTVHAFLSVYGKGVKDVARDLDQYIHGNRFYAALFDVKLEKSAEDPQVSAASPVETGLILADLLSFVHKPSEARAAYEQLAKDNPGNPYVEESLGYLDLAQNNLESARGHFAQAFAAGSKSAQMCFDYAALESQASPASKEIVPILRRAVELKPDFIDARIRLGLALVNQKSYAEAVDQLHQVKKVNPNQAPSLFLALAFAELQAGRLDGARQNAEAAKKWAKTPEDSEHADSILKVLDSMQAAKAPAAPATSRLEATNDSDPGPPTLARRPAPASEVHEITVPAKPEEHLNHAEGIAQKLDCDGEPLQFYVQVGRATMIFEIPDPKQVRIKHADEATHDFSCGPQKPYPVTVYYADQPDLKKGTAGVVRELDF